MAITQITFQVEAEFNPEFKLTHTLCASVDLKLNFTYILKLKVSFEFEMCA